MCDKTLKLYEITDHIEEEEDDIQKKNEKSEKTNQAALLSFELSFRELLIEGVLEDFE